MFPHLVKIAVLTGLFGALSGCEDGLRLPGQAGADGSAAGEGAPVQQQSTRIVERDVEAPGVFQKSEAGLWDGRPSLGGVWVAHPDVKDPERVIIRNESNGKFVIGALFRRERDNPGPRLQVSSDAAESLSMLAGQPVELNVTALRREEVAEEPPADGAATAAISAPEDIQALSLDSPDAPPAAAIPAESAAPAPIAAGPADPAPAGSSFIQIGIFSVRTNAENTATALRGAGMTPQVREQTSSGKTFFSVAVGPASRAERDALLRKVKAMGFTDAYFTSN